MAVELDKSLEWKTATHDASAMLDELQPNILKGHVRDHLSVLLLRFEDQSDARTFLSRLVGLMKSAKTHLKEAEAFKKARKRGTPYVGVALSFEGYAALGIIAANRPPDRSFERGMRVPATQRTLSDPPVSTWEERYRGPIHAIVLIADATDASVSAQRTMVHGLIPVSATILGEETGLGQRNRDGKGIEHFGYVDGRSQPLFLVEDVVEERETTDGAAVWNPEFPLEQVIVPDTAAPDPVKHFGSYLVFRKLEQNVVRFKEEEQQLARDLGLSEEDHERAGAMLVGRFEDGTPVTLQSSDGAHNPVMNDFRYASDDQGMKCPLYAHIRKVNPRSSRATDRRRLMARRGQTYGMRLDDVNDEDVPTSARPAAGVGLLFMAFNSSIARQFEYTQKRLANDAGSAAGPTSGADPVVGQGIRAKIASPTSWGGTKVRTTDPVAQAVTMKGGEYFFMPSLAFLRSL
jgi:Dyp-type peroxidase family